MSNVLLTDPPHTPPRRRFMVGASTIAAMQAVPPLQAAVPSADAPKAERAAELARKVSVAPPLAPPALSMAVANTQGVLWATALGKADMEFDVAATPAHLFRLGSVDRKSTRL